MNIKSDLLDKSKPLRIAKREELTDELLQEVIVRDSKLWLGNFENKAIAQAIWLDTSKPIKITIRGSAIKHTLNRHGADSVLVRQNKQPPIDNDDIINHANIVNNADKYKLEINKDGQNVLVSGKQINGYCVIVETVRVKQNELKFKSIYKENGDLTNHRAFKANGVINRKSGAESLSPKPSNHLDNAPAVSGDIIPQNDKDKQESNQIESIKDESIKEQTKEALKHIQSKTKSVDKDIER